MLEELHLRISFILLDTDFTVLKVDLNNSIIFNQSSNNLRIIKHGKQDSNL